MGCLKLTYYQLQNLGTELRIVHSKRELTLEKSIKKERSSNKYLYNGKEIQDDVINGISLNWYDYGARFYDAQVGRFTTQDAFATKYFSLSPYQYAANNPIKNIDVNGDSINVSNLIFQNGKLNAEGLYALFYMVADLQDITGLNISVNGRGRLAVSGKEATGSEKARKYVTGLINSSSTITVSNDNAQVTRGGGVGYVNLNTNQIDDNIQSTKNAGFAELTNGYGMSFIHESLHTRTGTFTLNPTATSLFDDPNNPSDILGSCERKVNEFRNELGLPERSQYSWQKDASTGITTQNWSSGGQVVPVTKTTMSPADKQSRRAIYDFMANFNFKIF